MKVLLLANQPENTTRLKMFRDTIQGLGHDVAVPKFGTKNWMKIAGKAKEIVKRERPDAVHVFNVPDIIYHGLPKLKGEFFNHLIYEMEELREILLSGKGSILTHSAVTGDDSYSAEISETYTWSANRVD
jgi:hypothetical protein